MNEHEPIFSELLPQSCIKKLNQTNYYSRRRTDSDRNLKYYPKFSNCIWLSVFWMSAFRLFEWTTFFFFSAFSAFRPSVRLCVCSGREKTKESLSFALSFLVLHFVLFAQHKEKGKHFPLSHSDCWMNNNTHPPTSRIQNQMDVEGWLMFRPLCAVGEETTRDDISSENQMVFLISFFLGRSFYGDASLDSA